MVKKKICKNCKLFVEDNECPICKGNQFVNNWQGKVIVLDANKSDIGKKMGIEVKGEYAIKCR